MVALALAGCGVHRVRLESFDAADLALPVGPIAVEAGSDPLSVEAADGFRWVLGQAGVRVVDPREGAQLVTISAPIPRDAVRVDPSDQGFEAERQTSVVATLRWVDPAGTELDALLDVATTDRWWSTGPTRDEALAKLIPADQAAADLARSLGAAYAHRLVDVRTRVVREVYRGGPLREGATELDAGDPRRALVSWQDLADHSADPRVAARAEHDLAVAYEMAGEFALAVQHAEAAAAADPRERAYLDELRAIEAEHRPLMRLVEASAGG